MPPHRDLRSAGSATGHANAGQAEIIEDLPPPPPNLPSLGVPAEGKMADLIQAMMGAF